MCVTVRLPSLFRLIRVSGSRLSRCHPTWKSVVPGRFKGRHVYCSFTPVECPPPSLLKMSGLPSYLACTAFDFSNLSQTYLQVVCGTDDILLCNHGCAPLIRSNESETAVQGWPEDLGFIRREWNPKGTQLKQNISRPTHYCQIFVRYTCKQLFSLSHFWNFYSPFLCSYSGLQFGGERSDHCVHSQGVLDW